WCFAGISLALHSSRLSSKHRTLRENYASITLYAYASAVRVSARGFTLAQFGDRPELVQCLALDLGKLHFLGLVVLPDQRDVIVCFAPHLNQGVTKKHVN